MKSEHDLINPKIQHQADIDFKIQHQQEQSLHLQIAIIKEENLQKNDFQFWQKKCPKDHYMRFTDIKGAKTVCSVCQIVIQKHSFMNWLCKYCKYHVCVDCLGFSSKYCPYNHPLQVNSYEVGSVTCDICRGNKFEGGLTCSCDYEICQNCILKEKSRH